MNSLITVVQLESARRVAKKLTRRGPSPLVLEPRIMFDGATADAAIAAITSAAEVPFAVADHAEGRTYAEGRTAVEHQDVLVAAAVVSEPQRNEILFIADNVQDGGRLAAVAAQSGVDVVVLDHTRSGLQQMIEVLDARAPVNTIHLVTHGDAGKIVIGSSVVSSDNVDSYASELQLLGRHITIDGDLLVYGCDIAFGESGQALVERLAQLTGADVAASNDVTGSSAVGGDWDLETRSGEIESTTAVFENTDWDGTLVSQTVFDANWQSLTFQNPVSVSGSGSGTSNGDVMRFDNVITLNGQSIDAVVTTSLDRATMSAYDSTQNPSNVSAYFQPTLNASSAGGNATFTISFYLNGTYTGAGTGIAATLQNVVVNSYDIDSTGGSDRQFQSFKGFARYQLSNATNLVPSVQQDGSVTFLYTSNTPTNNGTVTNDGYRVRVYYDSMSTFQVNAGVAGASGQAYFAFDFSVGPNWAGPTTTTGTPAPNLAYSQTVFAEAAANVGSISATSTITLANGTFTGVDGQALSGVSFGNVPAGLTAQVIRTSSTTAELSFTGSANAHANANDIANMRVTFGNAAFSSGNAGAVTGATRSDLAIDFNDPTADTQAPVVAAGQVLNYLENRGSADVLGTVAATDDIGVTGFRFADTSTTISSDGWFAIANDGGIKLTAAGRSAGASTNDYEITPNSFTHLIQARDVAGNWSSAVNVTLRVNDLDEVAPTFTSGSTSRTNENQTILYSAAATDLVQFTDQVVTYSLKPGTGDASLLTINQNTGVVQLTTGNLDFESQSSYSFTVIARDATGNSREQAVFVAVSDADEVSPTITISSSQSSLRANDSALITFTFSEDVGSSFDATDISVTAGTLGPLTRVDATHYTALYTPAGNAGAGNVDVAVAVGQVRDGASNANVAGASLMLSVDTAAPVITGPGQSVGLTSRHSIAENTSAVHTFTADEPVTWSIGSGEDASFFTITSAGELSFVSSPDFELPQDGSTEGRNTYVVDVVAVDTAGNTSSQRVTVTILNANDAPIGANASFTMLEDTLYNSALPIASDPDSDPISYAVTVGPTHGVLQLATNGSYTYTPAIDFYGQDSFTYTVSDNQGASNTYTVNITVTSTPDAPIAAPMSLTTAEDIGKSGVLPTATDADGDIVTYSKSSDPAHGTLTITSSGNYIYTPHQNYHAQDSFSYKVEDGTGRSNTYSVSVTITPSADAPIASNAAFTTAEDTQKTGTLPSAIDVDGDTVTYSASSNPQHGSVSITSSGTYTYTPAADYSGADSFIYAVSDGNGGTNTYTVSITVTPVGDAPVAAPMTITTPEDTAMTGVLPVGVDADGDHVIYSLATAPLHGIVSVTPAGSYTYTPAADYYGSDSFNYSVSDGNGGSNTYTVSIIVASVQDAPSGSGGSITTLEDTQIQGSLPTAHDADGDRIVYVKASEPSHGSVTISAAGSYVYTPAPNYSGQDSFTYTISDAQGADSTYTMSVTVLPANDAPTAAKGFATIAEDSFLRSLLPSSHDVDGDVVSYALTRGAAHGVVTVAGDGSYTYTPEPNYNRTDSFIYTVLDGNGGSNSYAVDITVTPVNDAPQDAGSARGEATVGEPMVPVSFPAFTDIDGPNTSYVATLSDGSRLPQWLVFDSSTRTFTGTPPLESIGTWTVVVTGSDGEFTDKTSVTITVNNPLPPSQQVIINLMEKDTGQSASDFITTDGSAGRSVSGTIAAPLGMNQVVQVSFDGGSSWQVARTTGTNWTASDDSGHGNNWTIAARVANTVTAQRSATVIQNVVLDMTPPAAPTVNSISTGSRTPILTGTASVRDGEQLQVAVNGVTYTVTPQGERWSLDLSTATPVVGTLTPLSPGQSYEVVATIIDTAGNVRSGEQEGTVTIALPIVPAELSPAPAVAQLVPVSVTTLPTPTPVSEPVSISQFIDTIARTTETVVPGSLFASDRSDYGSGIGTRSPEQSSSVNLRAAELSDVYTRSEGFRTVVAKAEEPALVLFQGVPDQFVDAGGALSLTIPADAFAHTQPKAIVRLSAVLQDGRPLPVWVEFNGQTGQFTGEVPKNLKGELRIKLVARDLEGREATALFRINVAQDRQALERASSRGGDTFAGKTSLSQQLRASQTRR